MWNKTLDSDCCITLLILKLVSALTVRLILFGFFFLPLVQFRGEDFGTSGQYNQTSAGRDWSQDLCAGQRIHERQIQGNTVHAHTNIWCYTPVRRVPEAIKHLACILGEWQAVSPDGVNSLDSSS